MKTNYFKPVKAKTPAVALATSLYTAAITENK